MSNTEVSQTAKPVTGWREQLKQGQVIPAHPLALTADRKLDEQRQRALTRYYLDAGSGGLAVGVHTTQFEIRDPKIGLFEPVLALAAEECRGKDVIRIAGVCGQTKQAVAEATLARDLGYHAMLLSLAALGSASDDQLIAHVQTLGEVLPVVGFYLQPAVGGRPLSYDFWRRFAAIESVVAIKIAPFSRYETQAVIRGVADSGRGSEIALYTGNDDHIILDFAQTFEFSGQQFRITGGLLGHWSFGTKRAVEQLHAIRAEVERTGTIGAEWLKMAAQVTDMNAAVFDVANHFHGCIPGINEILRRQGLLEGRYCIDPLEDLSPGQTEEINRVMTAYPHLTDDVFVKENLHRWLS